MPYYTTTCMCKAALKSCVTLHPPCLPHVKRISRFPSPSHNDALVHRRSPFVCSCPIRLPRRKLCYIYSPRLLANNLQSLNLLVMVSSARVDRLRKLVRPDLELLPDRPVSPDTDTNSASDDASGGVLLEPTPPHVSASKQTASNEADASIKIPPVVNTDRRFVWVKGIESPFNPNLDSMRPMTAPPPSGATKLPAIDLQRGDLASARNHYTPIQALAKYPYKYCNKNRMQAIASAFFDQGKFWEREWDL